MLQLRDVTVRIGELSILRSLSLEAPAGSIVGLVGRNGAGKTTTLKSVMGLVPVAAGEVIFHGQDLTRLPSHRRAALGIGYMPEDRRLVTSLTAEENMLLPLWAQGDREGSERLDQVYSLMPELKPLAGRKASQLSGGQQKLVALGRSLLCGRRLLLLDEPMEGVSPALSARMAEVVRAYQRGQPELIVLVAESDVSRINLLTDVVYTIERGEIVGNSHPAPR